MGPFTDLANRYLAHLQTRGFAPSTVRGYAFDLLNLGRFLTERGVSRRRATDRSAAEGQGMRVAVFYRKVHDRLLRALVTAGDQSPAPVEIRRALATIDRVIAACAEQARLGIAA